MNNRPKLRVVRGDQEVLGMPPDGDVPLEGLSERLLELGTDAIAEQLLSEPSGQDDLPTPLDVPGARIKTEYVLALLDDAVAMCCPDTEEEFCLEDDFKHHLLASHLGQLEVFLNRPFIVQLLNEGRLDLVREWAMDSIWNQPIYFTRKGKPKIRKDLPWDSWRT